MIYISTKDGIKAVDKPNKHTKKYLSQHSAETNRSRQAPLRERAARQHTKTIIVELPQLIIDELALYAQQNKKTLCEIICDWFWDEIEPYKNVKAPRDPLYEAVRLSIRPQAELELTLPKSVVNGLAAYAKNHEKPLYHMIEDWWQELDIKPDTNTTK